VGRIAFFSVKEILTKILLSVMFYLLFATVFPKGGGRCDAVQIRQVPRFSTILVEVLPKTEH